MTSTTSESSDTVKPVETVDLEKKLSIGVQEAFNNPEYERYLALHELFKGDGHKKLVRKRAYFPVCIYGMY